MEDLNETNTLLLLKQLVKFKAFINDADGQIGPISFRDINGFLGREEGYESRDAEKARQELKTDKWNEHCPGDGFVSRHAIRAMRNAGNLVNHYQITDFENRLNPHHQEYRPQAERALYDIYCNPLCSEAEVFENAVRVFGGKYDRMSFLFFIKDDSRFLPVSPGRFEKRRFFGVASYLYRFLNQYIALFCPL